MAEIESTLHSGWLMRHKAVMPKWLSLYYDSPIELVSGEGRHVFDRDGRRYLDFFGGILTTMTGYNVKEVVSAISKQAEKMIHSSTLYLISPMIELAEEIATLSGIEDPKVFFTTSGTEANDAALLLATAYRGTNQIIAVRNSYHGRSFSALSVTANTHYRANSYSPFQVSYVLGGSRLRGPLANLGDQEYIERGVTDLEDVLQTQTNGHVAALIAEPIQGVGGFAVPPDGYFGQIQRVLKSSGALYISDEVQTGWGRTGENFWGYKAQGVTPDIVTFAKGIGNGLALAGVVARAEIMDAFSAASISTFGGSPLAAAGGLANLRYLLANKLQENALKTGSVLFATLNSASSEAPAVADVRGKGLMIGVEICEPGTVTPDPTTTSRVMELAKEKGLLVGKGGLAGNVLRIAPPLSLTEDEARYGAEVLAEVLIDVSREGN
ncbi:4-aminobutyrate aminotransferase [Ferrithrix thermotolerans DSM 19514]|uniref:alanine--glyoxylate transaminase n=1 Tax=Ferrithrix thermotolerans DSM 19514 TaxID=1121881 RepID=A0A1M4SI09_9ACTN|nr:aspartate aminotransferase family protein [Ferrithrix thermotolerans]SHE31829.1 4-aminobutyrate aminotransferase [Ferrithrix thermotolerans DSM 19514]